MDYAACFQQGLPYRDFLQKYGTVAQQERWENFYQALHLTADQRALLSRFTREMKIVVLAGAWCGDCVNQCPIFERFAEATPRIEVRYLDRDTHPEIQPLLSICGGARVPVVLFLSEDFQQVGWYGDRTLAKYRSLIGSLEGAACPTGIVLEDRHLTAAVVQDWLDEFERAQWILRTSARLRKLHND